MQAQTPQRVPLLNLDSGAGLSQPAAFEPVHAPKAAKPAPASGVQIAGWTSPQPPRVLVIDDDELMCEMLAEALQAIGCEVTQAGSTTPWMVSCIESETGQAGSQYDLVISDIRMPGIGGLGLLENLPGDQPRTPTILITAYGDANTHERAMRAGAVAVLDKPFSIQSLMHWVDHVLGGSAH